MPVDPDWKNKLLMPVDPDWKNKKCGDCDNWVEMQLPQQGMLVQKDRPKIMQCRVNPPGSIGIPIPTPHGLQLQVTTAYPKVEPLSDACKQFTQRLETTTITDNTIENLQPIDFKNFNKGGSEPL